MAKSCCTFSLLLLLGCAVLSSSTGSAQSTATAQIAGTVADPSGARVSKAVVHAEGHDIQRDAGTRDAGTRDAVTRETVTDATGHYTLVLPPGGYDITILAPGFDPFVATVDLTAKPVTTLDARLVIATQAQEISVPSDNSAGTDAADNKSALNFKASDLQTFSSDDATFQQQIQALAGSGDNSNGPQVYVDGFSNGRFPPKNSIREIRINQNPYSAQYDSLGYGRIEIFTKPGSDKLHGYFDVSGNNNSLNTTDPYAGVQPPYHVLNFEGNLSGPINKKTSLFLSGLYNDQQSNAIVHATSLDLTTLAPIDFNQAVASPATTSTYSGRIDRQIGANNTLTARYEFNRALQTNGGIGLLVLPEQGTNSTTTTQSLQISNTQILGTKMVSETHFQYLRTRLEQNAISNAPTLTVQGAFNGGGNPSQTTNDNQDRYEFQELFTHEQAKHFLRFGARYRLLRDANLSTANFNGGYTFPSITAYQLTLQNQRNCAANPVSATCLTPAQLTAAGGGPSQFNLTSGQPSAVVSTGDLGLFAEDEWKLTKTFTLDLGMRFETQSAIPDHFDPAPRVGFAWAIGQNKKKQPIVTVRGGGGIFYDRFSSTNILTSVRENGITQPSYYVSNPTFYPTVPLPSALTATLPTVYQISPNLRSEYSLFGGLAVERRLWDKGTITFNYLHSHGVHEWNSANINAPLPGTYVPANPAKMTPARGVYPFGTTQAVYQFQSAGTFNNDRAFANLQLNPTKHIFLFMFYVLRHQYTDSQGATSFASNSYNIGEDYGRSGNRGQRLFVGSFYRLPLGVSVNSFLSASAGQAFNITTGTDLNGDSIYNDRPSFATAASPTGSVVSTHFGRFNTTPQPGETTIPFNYANGPAFVELDFGLRKAFKFGPRQAPEALPAGAPAPKGPPEQPDPRYALALAVDAQNVLNHVNPGVPVGTLSSPQFGQSISLSNPYGSSNSATRVIRLHMSFEF